MGIWREYNYQGLGAGGGNGRRPLVNIIPTSLDSPPNESRFCQRCNAQLSYLRLENVWACTKCTWNLPKHLLEEESSSSSSPSPSLSPPDQNSRVGTVDLVTESEELANNSVPVVSKARRTEELANRVQRLPGEDADTDRMKQKMKLVDSAEDLPPGDVETFTSDGLTYHNDKARMSRRIH